MRISPFIAISIGFAIKTGINPDPASVILSVCFLSAHLLVHFLGADTVRARLIKQMADHEAVTAKDIASIQAELAEVKRLQSQSNLAQGIRPGFGVK